MAGSHAGIAILVCQRLGWERCLFFDRLGYLEPNGPHIGWQHTLRLGKGDAPPVKSSDLSKLHLCLYIRLRDVLRTCRMGFAE
jgi:hypothetical protein